MLAQPTEFPHPGSRGFLAKSADPVTIIRRNRDGTALVRIDARPHHARNRDASGNRTVPANELFGSEEDAARARTAAPKSKRRAK